MKRFSHLAALALIVMLAFPAEAATDKTTQAALDQIKAKAAKVKTFSADFQVKMAASGHKATTKGKLSFQVPDKIHLAASVMMGSIKQDTVTIIDGTTMWIQMPAFGANVKIDLVKLKKALADLGVPYRNQHNVADPLASMEPGTVKLVGTKGKLEGKDHLVFEGQTAKVAAKEAAGAPMVKVWVLPADGLVRQIAFLDAGKKPLVTYIYENVKVNPPLKADLFNYKPPANAMVMDQTDMFIGVMKRMIQQSGGAKKVPAPDANK